MTHEHSHAKVRYTKQRSQPRTIYPADELFFKKKVSCKGKRSVREGSKVTLDRGVLYIRTKLPSASICWHSLQVLEPLKLALKLIITNQKVEDTYFAKYSSQLQNPWLFRLLVLRNANIAQGQPPFCAYQTEEEELLQTELFLYLHSAL